MKWLANSFRPLSIKELAEVFILDPGKPIPFDENGRLLSAEDVLNYLPGLVVKSAAKYTGKIQIRFAHFSIKEYLSSDRIHEAQLLFSVRDQSSSHLHIAESCLAYHLCLSNSIIATQTTVEPYALWVYASQDGVRHLEMVARERWTPSVTGLAIRAFTAGSQSLLNVQGMKGYMSDSPQLELAAPLYCAARLNFVQLALQLIQNGAEVDEVSVGSIFGTALTVAAAGGYDDMIIMLLENNAAIDWNSELKHTPLGAATVYADLGTISLLLDKGADPNIGGRMYGSPLQAAAYRGNLTFVHLFLDHGANVNTGGGMYGSPLQAAAYRKCLNIVQVLLDHGADVNIRGGMHGSTLQAAASGDALDIAQLLLARGADVHTKGGTYGNAIQATIGEGFRQSWKIAKLFHLQGAMVDPPGQEWEEMLARVATEKFNGPTVVERLRKFQEDPEGYIERRG